MLFPGLEGIAAEPSQVGFEVRGETVRLRLPIPPLSEATPEADQAGFEILLKSGHLILLLFLFLDATRKFPRFPIKPTFPRWVG